MKEPNLHSLIAAGENDNVEFKRELHLDSADGKVEFIKDIIALVNSSADGGYLLVGIDNNKTIVGCSTLEEERLQQLASTYIYPTITLKASLVEVHTPDSRSVGVLEVYPAERPHHVARNIGRLNQNDVFVRHGTVVEKASPAEMFAMRDQSRLGADRRNYLRAAELHAKIGNLPNAIAAYSNAIELMPTADLFLARGKIYARQASLQAETKIERELCHSAFKDFSHALKLTDSIEIAKQSHLARLRLWSVLTDDRDTFEGDLDWCKANTTGVELGEALYLRWQTIEDIIGINDDTAEAIKDLDNAIQLGYQTGEAYYLRAIVHFFMHNYGLALCDFDLALPKLAESRKLMDYICLRATVLARVGQFNEAFDAFSSARALSKDQIPDSWGYLGSGLQDEILNIFCLAYEFSPNSRLEVEIMRPIVQRLLIYSVSREFLKSNSNGKLQRVKATVKRRYQKLIQTLRNIVGEEFWQQNRSQLE